MHVVSLYFMSSRDDKNLLDEENLYKFLNKTTSMIFIYCIINLTIHYIQQPFVMEFENIIQGKGLQFTDFKQDRKIFMDKMRNLKFSNSRGITRAILT